jgi:hypothetical protein
MDLLDDLDDLDDDTNNLLPIEPDQMDIETQDSLLHNKFPYPTVKISPETLIATIEKIKSLLHRPQIALLSGSFEDDEEYSMILEANQISINLDGISLFSYYVFKTISYYYSSI